jgi:hypothetical protein
VPKCQFCGKTYPQARLTEAGFSYCMDPDCVAKGRKPLGLVAVGVNKAAPVYELRSQTGVDSRILVGHERVKLSADAMPIHARRGSRR